jgi:hypothetical protein
MADFMFLDGRFLGAIDSNFVLVGLLGMLLTSMALIGNLARVERKVLLCGSGHRGDCHRLFAWSLFAVHAGYRRLNQSKPSPSSFPLAKINSCLKKMMPR